MRTTIVQKATDITKTVFAKIDNLLDRIPAEVWIVMLFAGLAMLGHWWLASIIAALYAGFWIGRVVEVLDQIGRILDRTEER